ncbi:MAG: N-formylglutamate deformylase [Arenimonas sp.]
MQTFNLHHGTAPLLISLPHDGTALPNDLVGRLTGDARKVPDTDWFVSRLYGFARSLGASILWPVNSRYVVDLNRPPDDASLYPGRNTTGLCPTSRFDGGPVYLEGHTPTPADIAYRVDYYWRPYHQALAAELHRKKLLHKRVLLWEGHSIRSRVPFLFEGTLPDLNLGTADGTSCDAALQSRLQRVLLELPDYTEVTNGRFKGGYITRHYGQPDKGIDAVQLELAQSTYMDEATGKWDEVKALKLQAVLRKLLMAGLAYEH